MISVIGAGPAGSYFASKSDEDVHIFEEHATCGEPIACTGIITDAVEQFIKVPREHLVTTIKQFKMIAPNKKEMYVDLKKNNYVFDRAKFDQHLLQQAIDSGAKIHFDEKFLGYKKEGKKYTIKTSKKTYESSMLVGADGPFSSVAKAAGIFGKRSFVKGWQARCYYPDLEPGVTQIHMNLGEFSWVVPENEEIARVGVIGADTPQLEKDYKTLLGSAKIIEDQSGMIPMYNPRQRIRKGSEDIFLLGDAATHVKATTYGGILYGMIAGDYLAKDKESFVANVNKKLSKDLWVSLKMRDMMNSMSDSQADDMIQIFQKKSNNDILATHDRNFPSKFLVQLLMKEAKLWKLGFGIFKNKMFGKKEATMDELFAK